VLPCPPYAPFVVFLVVFAVLMAATYLLGLI
jgi:hypothetical protein